MNVGLDKTNYIPNTHRPIAYDKSLNIMPIER